jgi:hypothetical protein
MSLFNLKQIFISLVEVSIFLSEPMKESALNESKKYLMQSKERNAILQFYSGKFFSPSTYIRKKHRRRFFFFVRMTENSSSKKVTSLQ